MSLPADTTPQSEDQPALAIKRRLGKTRLIAATIAAILLGALAGVGVSTLTPSYGTVAAAAHYACGGNYVEKPETPAAERDIRCANGDEYIVRRHRDGRYAVKKVDDKSFDPTPFLMF